MIKYTPIIDFKRIRISSNQILASNYNKLWKLFKENTKLNINKIKLKGNFYLNNLSDEGLKAHIHYLSDIDLINLKNLNSLQILELHHLQEKRVLMDINNLKTQIYSIQLSLKDVIKFNIQANIIPSKILKESVMWLIVKYASAKKLNTLDQVIKYFISTFPKLDSIKVKSLHIVINFLSSFISSTMTWIEISKLKLKELEIGNKDEENCTIVKSFPRILWYNLESNQARVIKATKLILQFSTGKTLTYSNDQILIFRGFSYFKITNVCFEPNEQSYLDYFKKHLPKDYANFK